MANPLIAIVGRPNVGKSTFFNKVVGRKVSITEDRPGVTRDRLYADAEWQGRKFTVVDTGGIELKSDDNMWRHIARQADIAIETAMITLTTSDLRQLPKAIRLSRKTFYIIRENLFWAFIYNIIGVPVAAGVLFPVFGVTLDPMWASAAMAISSITVVLNSLRLKLLKL